MSALPSLITVPPRSAGRAQGLAARLTGSPLFWVIAVILLFALPLVRSVERELPTAPPVLGVLPAFSFVTQEGKTFDNRRAEGQLLIAEFVPEAAFAAGEVSPLARLQKRVRNAGKAVRLVSFVHMADAEPAPAAAVLDGIARSAHAGAWRWTFAGGDTSALEERAEKLLALPAGSLSGDRKLLLVDPRGQIRRVAPSTPAGIDLLMRDTGLIVNLEWQPSPAYGRRTDKE